MTLIAFNTTITYKAKIVIITFKNENLTSESGSRIFFLDSTSKFKTSIFNIPSTYIYCLAKNTVHGALLRKCTGKPYYCTKHLTQLHTDTK